jgi:serine/threonine protein kinase
MSADRYVLGDEIARGGMGVVYRATDSALGRDVAVKVLQDRFGPASGAARRFADEARITGQLQHPAIPPVHDLGTLPDGRPFLAMKLVKGHTLDALLKARPNPGEERGRFVAVFEQVCQALAFAHAHNVIHRDLKPANVMVGSYGEVQVMDWGLAKVLGARPAMSDGPDETGSETAIQSARESDGEFTQAGAILGTPAFMPPEQAIGAVDQVDARSDVFGLGGILCVILTGQPPFTGDSAESIRQEAARGKVAAAFARLDASGADPELIALGKRCLAPEKENRPADAGAVARTVTDLRMAAEERARRAELERAASEARSAERRKRRRLMVAAAVALAVALVAGLSAVLLVQRRANADLAKQQAKVEARFELAQKAIAKLHTGVSEDMLLKSDQFKELRTQLLKDAAGFYGDLEKMLEGEADAKSRRLLADGYFQLAELTAQIGSKSEALALHRKALAVRRELAAAAGADVETRLDVARSLSAIGLLLFSTGDWEAAHQSFKEQHDVAAALGAEHPTEAVQAVLAASLANSGRVLTLEQKSGEGLAAGREAVAILRKLVDANPGASELQFDLASSQIYSANNLFDVGKRMEALAALKDARAVLQKLAGADPNNVRFANTLRICHSNISYFLFVEGRTAEALASARESLAISQRLSDTHPAVTQFQISTAMNQDNIGRTLAEMGKPAEAMAAYERMRAISQKVVDAGRTDVWALWQLCGSFDGIGEVYAQMGRSAEALKAYEKARALLPKTTEGNSASFPFLQGERARNLEKTGLLLSGSGKTEDALAACQKALAIRQRLSDAQPAVIWMREDLADSLSALGTVQRRAGQPSEAVASFRRAIALVERLPTLSVRNHYNLGRYQALLAGLATESGSGLTAEEGVAAAERSMAALRQAVAAGYGNVAQLRTDASLDTLRPREEFRKLLRELEEKAAKAQEAAPLTGPK